LSLYHLYEYDPDLHKTANEVAGCVREFGEAGLESSAIKALADAYLDLLEKRGLPPKLFIEPSIQLCSGRYFNFLDPDATPVTPEEIAHALGNVARCAGHTIFDMPVPVGQHCVLASRAAPAPFKFEALMHDAVEAFTGDVTTPLKQCLADFKRIEKYCEHSVRRQYLLPLEMSPEVKAIDVRMACTEKRDCLPPDPPGEGWEMLEGIDPYEIIITPWSAKQAKTRWLAEFNALWPEHMARNLPRESDQREDAAWPSFSIEARRELATRLGLYDPVTQDIP